MQETPSAKNGKNPYTCHEQVPSGVHLWRIQISLPWDLVPLDLEPYHHQTQPLTVAPSPCAEAQTRFRGSYACRIRPFGSSVSMRGKQPTHKLQHTFRRNLKAVTYQ